MSSKLGSIGSGCNTAQGRHWALFVDWCIATGQRPLPAEPATVAAFLTELPIGTATAARRVRAIDAAHAAAGLPGPGGRAELDALLGRTPAPPRFEADLVARALGAIPVGGWPAGIVGRRDGAIVALICSAGLTRAQVQALRSATSDVGSLPGRLGLGEEDADAGACSACALTRWLRVAERVERDGWRAVRAELADYGEVPAGEENTHDCARPLSWSSDSGAGRGSPLFCPIDRHGAPESGYPLSRRSITAIVASRLSFAEADVDARTAAGPDRDVQESQALGDHDWGVEQRRQAAERFAEIEAVLDEAEAHAEAILARVQAAMAPDLTEDGAVPPR